MKTYNIYWEAVGRTDFGLSEADAKFAIQCGSDCIVTDDRGHVVAEGWRAAGVWRNYWKEDFE